MWLRLRVRGSAGAMLTSTLVPDGLICQDELHGVCSKKSVGAGVTSGWSDLSGRALHQRLRVSRRIRCRDRATAPRDWRAVSRLGGVGGCHDRADRRGSCWSVRQTSLARSGKMGQGCVIQISSRMRADARARNVHDDVHSATMS